VLKLHIKSAAVVFQFPAILMLQVDLITVK